MEKSRSSSRFGWKATGILLSLAAAAAIFVVSGCVGGGRAPQIRNYTLEYDPPEPHEGETLPVVLRVARFQAAPAYDSARMIYQEADHRQSQYHYHRWTAPPGELVAQLIQRDLRASGLFRAVLPPASPLPSTHLLDGAVDRFLEIDSPDRWEALVELTITLSDEDVADPAQRVVMQRTYQRKEAAAEKDPSAVAEAMSRAVRQMSAEIVADVRLALSEAKR